MRGWSRREVAWALYDWANSAFATAVMAGFFPVFFKLYWNAGEEAATSTFRLGVANAAARLVVALAAPLLGALADRGGGRKGWLGLFTALGVAATALLAGLGEGAWLAAAWLYGLAVVGFAAGNVFYDALLVAVTEPARYHRVSALGYGLGYLGGGLLFALAVALAQWPGALGLEREGAVRLAFLLTALWWGLFSLPLFLRVPEPAGEGAAAGWGRLLGESLAELRGVLRRLWRSPALRPAAWFLAAYWCYIDAVGTVIRMAVDYGLALGLEQGHLVGALLLTQFVSFPAALAFGRLGERFGARKAILMGLAVYLGAVLWGTRIETAAGFYVLAAVVGLVQGGVQSLSRSLYAALIPAAEAGAFFGLYNMLGKFAAVLGPALMGLAALWSGSVRWSILAVAALFLIGAALLLRVPEPRAAGSR